MIDLKVKAFSPTEKLTFTLVVALAAGLRLFRLGEESLWIDEGFSIRDASEGHFSAMRPIYFCLLRLWMTFGDSEAWLRSLAVVFGVGSVILMYFLARHLFGGKAAFLASVFMAISPLHINHSQEIRLYTLVTFVVLLEVRAFIRFLEAGRGRDLALTLVFAGLAFFTFPLTVLMLPVLNIFMILHLRAYRHLTLKWFLSQSIPALAAIPLIPRLSRTVSVFDNSWNWRLSPPGIRQVVEVTRDFNLWRIPETHENAVLVGNAYGGFVLALIAFGVWSMYRRARWQTTLTAVWLTIPIAATLVASHLVTYVWLVRYMIYVSPAYYLLAAVGLSAIRRKSIFVILLIVMVALPLARLCSYYSSHHRPEWRQAVAYIESHLGEGDSIAVYRYVNKPVFEYYYSGGAPWIAMGPRVVSRDSFIGWDEGRARQMLSQVPHSRRVWFVLSYHENAGGFTIERYIREHHRLLEEKDFERIKIFLVTPLEAES